MLQQLIAETLHDAIQEALKARFGTIPRDVTRLLREILDVKKLKRLNVAAVKCPDMQAFREALLS